MCMCVCVSHNWISEYEIDTQDWMKCEYTHMMYIFENECDKICRQMIVQYVCICMQYVSNYSFQSNLNYARLQTETLVRGTIPSQNYSRRTDLPNRHV